MNYKEAREYIQSTERFGSKLGLERILRVLYYLDNPQEKIKAIHVAGTNGKGSTSVMTAEILKSEGYSVGLYTSPYLEEFEERIRINSKNISKDDLAYIISKVKKAADLAALDGVGESTEFEIITCAGFLYFHEKAVDYVVLEVGLGGRYDATNVIKPILSVITSISYDHMHILGDTLEKIAYEKAGIIKKNVPLVLYTQEKGAEEVIKRIAKQNSIDIIELKDVEIKVNKIYEVDNKLVQNLTIKTKKHEYNIDLSLLGKHQVLNCAMAILAVEALENMKITIKKQSIEKGLRQVIWPGRFEILKNQPYVVIDGAHNIDGIRNLKESVFKYLKFKRLTLIIGILKDKEVENIIKTIVPCADKVICVKPHNIRAEHEEELNKIVKKYNNNSIFLKDYREAYNLAMENANVDDLVLICGSLYMIGDMRKIIKII
ncbi:MAG: folylpolyglutamate synthase/dihydrofolate synthase family protein [Clostridiaceae bacterium]